MEQNAFNLGRKYDFGSVVIIKKRFYAHAVADQIQTLLVPVPECDRKHTV